MHVIKKYSSLAFNLRFSFLKVVLYMRVWQGSFYRHPLVGIKESKVYTSIKRPTWNNMKF